MPIIRKQTKGKHIYWFAFYNLFSPSVRYRAKYPLEHLASNYDVSYTLVIPGYHPRKILLFLKAYFSALLSPTHTTAIVIQRVHSNFIYSTLLKTLVYFKQDCTAYDLDDADYLEQPARSLFHFAKHCHTLLVGSHELKENLRPFNRRITITTSPTPNLGIVKKCRNEKLNIGWIGCFGGGHKESLIQQFFPALEHLSFPVTLTLLGVTKEKERAFLKSFFSENSLIELKMPQNIDWQNEAEVQNHICSFDLGIATLIDDELHRSKSAFKLKQYLNNGVPVLSTPLPENQFFITEGKNGFLCSSSAVFANAIERIKNLSNAEYLEMQNHCLRSAHQFDLNQYCETLVNAIFEPQEQSAKVSAI